MFTFYHRRYGLDLGFLIVFDIVLPYRKNCWSLRGPCANGHGGLVGKAFENSLHLTDD